MSKINRGLARREADAIEDRLARIVPQLDPETLHQIIRHRGLDACGEIVATATPAQLTALLDIGLWRHTQPGRDESFDVDRFGEWLEALIEAGPSVAARTVAAMDEELVILGLSRYVRVFDPGIFEPIAQSDDEAVDRHDAMHEGDAIHAADATMPDSNEHEIGGYLVRGRRADAWDAIITLLTTLESEHAGYFDAIMKGCRRLSNSRPEIDGLDDLLMEPEQHLHEAAIERERRRSRQGYATPGDARAFLQMARRPKHARSETSTTEVNPIVTAYFRAADEAPVAREADAVSASPRAVIELMTEAGVIPERPRALLEAADDNAGPDRLTQLRRLMAYAHDTDEHAFRSRSRELAFLANTVLAGCLVQSRAFTPQEASEAAASVCNLGLESDAPPDGWLVDHSLVSAFEVGWSVLHRDVSLFVADQLISTLTDLRCADRDVQRELVELRRALVKQRDAGTPWLARGAADVLAMLDVTVWTSVLGLLDEYPILPAALTAIVEGRTTTISPTAFDFISTTAQIGDVHIFMRMVQRLLS